MTAWWDEMSDAAQKEYLRLHPTSKLKPGGRFTYLRNTVSSKRHKTNQDFEQKIEPTGRYLNYLDEAPKEVQPGWESGEHDFKKPLYIHHDGWKRKLSEAFDGKTGRALSRAIQAKGFDGIVTFDKYGASEIVDLTPFKPVRHALKRLQASMERARAEHNKAG